MINNNFYVIRKKNYQTPVSDADRDIKLEGKRNMPETMLNREIPTLRSTDNAGNSVNLVIGIIRLPSGFLGLYLKPMLDSICPKYIIVYEDTSLFFSQIFTKEIKS